MRILLLSHRFYPDFGGIESVSEMLANRFIESNHDIHVVTWTNVIGEKKFPFEVIRKPNVFNLIKQFIFADVILENNPSIRLGWPSFFFKKPLIISLHTWITRNNGNKNWIDKLKIRRLKLASFVIACSELVKERTFKPAIVIQSPYNELLFRTNKHGERPLDFIFIGRLVSDKGTDIAIKSIKKLQTLLGKDISLTIVGEGSEKKRLMQLSEDLHLKQILFTGKLTGEELVRCINKHRYALVPSVWDEPFGIVALEMMACGCLPIVSNCGGLPDAIGKAGLTFKQGDVNDLVLTVMNLFANPILEYTLRQAAPAHLKEHHSRAVANKYLTILSSYSLQ